MFKTRNILQRTIDSAIQGYGKRPWKNEAEKDAYIRHEISHIKSIAKLQTQLDKYQSEASSLDAEELMNEEASSAKLGKNMRASGKPKPNYRWDAHHIVSGSHNEAAALRGIIALLKLRIDDPNNGVWLPRRTADTGQNPYPRAVPHSRIHRQNYYDWLNESLLHIRDLSTFITTLNVIENMLLTANFPKKVMLVKGDKRASLAEYQEPFWDGTPWKSVGRI